MSKSIGVHVTDTHVRLAVIESKGESLSILSFLEAPVPADPGRPWSQRAAAVLRELTARTPLPSAPVIAGLDSGDVLIRTLSVPFKDEAQIRKGVKFELETHLTQYAAEDLVVDYTITGETDSGATLLAVAVPKALLGQRLAGLTEAGLDPEAMDLELLAVVRALQAAGALRTPEPAMLLHGGARHAKLVLVQEGSVRHLRTIRFSLPAAGPEPPAEGEEAPLVMVSEADPALESLPPAERAPLIKLLAKEISRFLLGAGTHAPERLLLTGELDHDSVAAELQEATRIPVTRIDPLSDVTHGFGAEEAPSIRRQILEPLGLALRGLPGAGEGLDFRQEEFASSGASEKLAGAAMILMELLLMLIATFCLHQFFRLNEAKTATVEVEARQRDLYKKSTGQDPPAGMSIAEALGRWAGGGPDYPLKRSALDELAPIMAALQEFGIQKPDMQITSVNADMMPGQPAGQIKIGGTLASATDAAALMNHLQGRKVRAAVENGFDNRTMREMFTLTIQTGSPP